MGIVGSSPTPGTALSPSELRTERAIRPHLLAFAQGMQKGTAPIVDAVRSMRLRAVRCTQCGDARWSLFSAADPERPCDLCGGEMRLERRSPGSGPRKLVRERRSGGPGVAPGSHRPLAG
jgi:hypothetical protein